MNSEAFIGSLTGRTIAGRFPLLEWLGSVGQGGVFLTEFKGAQPQKAAIRLVPADAEDAQNELKGWAAAAALSHAHLARLFDHGRCTVDGTELLYVLTELPEESLSLVLPVRPLTPTETVEMLSPVLDALSYLHGKGLVHGHLQPSNILVIGDQLKLPTDTLLRAGSVSNPTAAPQIYDAPEIAAGTISPAADVWSLGVTLVEALTQRTPAWAKSASGDSVSRGLASGELVRSDPVVPEQVPEPFAEIARRCLNQDPERRCTVQEIRALLNPAASLPEVLAVAVAKTEPSRPAEVAEAAQSESEFHDPLPSRRTLRSVEQGGLSGHRTPLLIIAAIVVVVALAVLLLRAHKTQPAPEPEAQTTANGAAPNPTPAPIAPTSPARGPVVKGGVAERVMPDVPEGASRTIRGKLNVGIRVKVDQAGNVSEAQMDSAVKSRYFTKLALEAARKWRFKPARVDGQAASSVWMLRFEFSNGGTEVTPVEVTP